MPSPPPRKKAIVGLFPCDLQGVAYLDRVFAEDALYRRHRDHLFLAGRTCSPGEDCFCPPDMDPAFDLFVGDEKIWASSIRGIEYLHDLEEERESSPPPVVREGKMQRYGSLEKPFRASREKPFWKQVGKKCFSCGACSAVCPTCYCYDVVDEATTGGEVRRWREWDNCFFRSHGLVAGGHNFRPGRGDRLRFRFEHKYLGFGDLKGVQSCVGCGRCRKACPAEIDLRKVLDLVIFPGGEQ